MTRKNRSSRNAQAEENRPIPHPEPPAKPGPKLNAPPGGKYADFIEHLPVLLYAVKPKPPYTPIYVSPAFEIFGYPLT